MIRKGSFFYSVIHEKCPRCQEGDLFKNKHMYSLRDIGGMPDQCPVCGQDYRIEDGFFLGATYVSYAMGIAISVPVLAILAVVFHLDILVILPILLVILVLLTPPIVRYSRSIWFNFFVHYDPDWKKETGK